MEAIENIEYSWTTYAKISGRVAGSYAPSSVRAGGKLNNVLDVQGTGPAATYNLVNNHANAALAGFLKGHRVPATSLSAFLYRDYGFQLEQAQISRVLPIFRDEFGLRSTMSEEDAVFQTLFEDDTDSFDDTDLQPLASADG